MEVQFVAKGLVSRLSVGASGPKLECSQTETSSYALVAFMSKDNFVFRRNELSPIPGFAA